ncbi:MAG: hypothetical protein LBH96_05220 [Candidatus Peribacteria bacterium]|nr:hypothetical protein [Candidatus Peribacteria bacterium]
MFVDFTEYSRISKFTSGYEDYFDSHHKIIIDHHVFYGEIKNSSIYRDSTAIATCEIIFELTTIWWDLIDADTATLLYMGIVTDSGNFRHDEKHQTLRLMEDALGLIKKGGDKQAVINNTFRNKSLEDLQFMQKILERIHRDGDIFYSWYTKVELEQF